MNILKIEINLDDVTAMDIGSMAEELRELIKDEIRKEVALVARKTAQSKRDAIAKRVAELIDLGVKR